GDGVVRELGARDGVVPELGGADAVLRHDRLDGRDPRPAEGDGEREARDDHRRRRPPDWEAWHARDPSVLRLYVEDRQAIGRPGGRREGARPVRVTSGPARTLDA